jgi:hypothetical protein
MVVIVVNNSKKLHSPILIHNNITNVIFSVMFLHAGRFSSHGVKTQLNVRKKTKGLVRDKF